ncbi:FMN-binding protein [Nocardioides humi]|uniref:FMN-binding domain-containing protein n=1 Tax=Nocardioides humi TaxID=449461 RepID=A0ABN2B8A1_9ACTN|nr:FMN-binding protein [Nocardioides humi]
MRRPSSSRLLGLAAVGLAGVGSACTAADEPADAADSDRGSGGYTAGDYTATGSYTTPGGAEKLEVSLTLDADGTISALTVTPLGVNPNSKKFQAQFASGIADVAVGKSIASLSVDKVAGSSLSSGGFNSALDAIADAAQP